MVKLRDNVINIMIRCLFSVETSQTSTIQMSPRGWMDPIPDLKYLEKIRIGSAGNISWVLLDSSQTVITRPI